MSATEAAVRDFQQFLGGEWTAAADGTTFDDYDPFTGDVVARVASGKREDARRAIESAAAAFPGWWKAPPAEKQRVFLKAAEVLESRTEDVAGWLTRETGATFGWGMFNVELGAGMFAFVNRGNISSRIANS